MTHIEHKTFENETVLMDDKYFNGCAFIGCTLIFCGGDFGWIDTKIEVCKLNFEGPALRTARYLFFFSKLKDECAAELGFKPKE